MAGLSEMQGVPAQLEYLKSDGQRRHPSYCIFAEGKGKKRICTSPLSKIYGQHCTSSKHCEQYEKKEKKE